MGTGKTGVLAGLVATLVLVAVAAVGIYLFRSTGGNGDSDEERARGVAAAVEERSVEEQAEEREGAGSQVEEPGTADLGELQVESQPADVKLAVIGPDRYARVHTAFRGGSPMRLLPGSYRIVSTYDGYKAASKEVEVPAGDAVLVSFELERE